MASADDRETLIGGIVLLMLVGLIAAVYVGGAREKAKEGYDLTARFNKAEGVAVGTEVRMSGVVVGKVLAQTLDPEFHAVLTLRLISGLALPKDSNATIATDGLLGSKYISLQPGADEANLKAGDKIAYTQDSLAVEDLLEMIIDQAKSAHGQASAGGAR